MTKRRDLTSAEEALYDALHEIGETFADDFTTFIQGAIKDIVVGNVYQTIEYIMAERGLLEVDE